MEKSWLDSSVASPDEPTYSIGFINDQTLLGLCASMAVFDIPDATQIERVDIYARQGSNSEFEEWLTDLPVQFPPLIGPISYCVNLPHYLICTADTLSTPMQSMHSGAFEVHQIAYDSAGRQILSAIGTG